jgi:hypothetical protein
MCQNTQHDHLSPHGADLGVKRRLQRYLVRSRGIIEFPLSPQSQTRPSKLFDADLMPGYPRTQAVPAQQFSKESFAIQTTVVTMNQMIHPFTLARKNDLRNLFLAAVIPCELYLLRAIKY